MVHHWPVAAYPTPPAARSPGARSLAATAALIRTISGSARPCSTPGGRVISTRLRAVRQGSVLMAEPNRPIKRGFQNRIDPTQAVDHPAPSRSALSAPIQRPVGRRGEEATSVRLQILSASLTRLAWSRSWPRARLGVACALPARVLSSVTATIAPTSGPNSRVSSSTVVSVSSIVSCSSAGAGVAASVTPPSRQHSREFQRVIDVARLRRPCVAGLGVCGRRTQPLSGSAWCGSSALVTHATCLAEDHLTGGRQLFDEVGPRTATSRVAWARTRPGCSGARARRRLCDSAPSRPIRRPATFVQQRRRGAPQVVDREGRIGCPRSATFSALLIALWAKGLVRLPRPGSTRSLPPARICSSLNSATAWRDRNTMRLAGLRVLGRDVPFGML